MIDRTCSRGGVVLIPSFAVARAQTLLYYIHLLKESKRIPADLPVFLNSPMAVDATQIYHKHRAQHRLDPDQCQAMCHVAKFVNSVEDSKRLNNRHGPMIIIAASGMASGGRIVHHLKAFAPDPSNTLLFSGFQVPGTRGSAILQGAQTVRIHGELVPIRAEISSIENLSAHADYVEIIDWLQLFQRPPLETFVTHGDPAAADAMRLHIEDKLGWNCRVPDHLETVSLA